MSVARIHGLSDMKTEIVTARIGPRASCNLSISSDLLADQMKRWRHMETYESVCDVSERSKDEKWAQAILENTTKHTGERYEVGLLWADDNPSLSNN